VIVSFAGRTLLHAVKIQTDNMISTEFVSTVNKLMGQLRILNRTELL